MRDRVCIFSVLNFLLFLCRANGVLWGEFNQARPQHGVRGRVRLLNSRTIQLENFSYDGQGFVVYLYYYRPGQEVDRNGNGFVIPVPDGGPNGRFPDDRRYNNEMLLLPLPEGVTACDIATLTVWCQPFRTFFNQVTLTRDVFSNDGDPCEVRPENIEVPLVTQPPPLDNCKVLDPSLQLRWRVDREAENVMFQLCGCLSSSPDVDQYMGFGVSGSDSATLMMGADPTITWVDTNARANAVDYHLSAYTQCVTNEGACPDTRDPNSCRDDATLVSGFRDNSRQCVTFTRPFTPSDVGTCDRTLDPDNANLYIVWGVGGLGNAAFRHFQRAQATDGPIHLGRTPMDECGDTPISCATCPAYQGQRMVARDSTTFRAVIGPSGNERGYMSITGRASWGIAWYLNGTLIPELVVQRGSTYRFIVEGGEDSSMPSAYHPFYITSSIIGSRLSDPAVRAEETVYAGFNTQGRETGVGRLCELTEGSAALASRTSCQSLDHYLGRLEEHPDCSQGAPGEVVWTPDQNTPNTVYYQCATHRNLGWRILVINPGDPVPALPGVGPPPSMVSATSVAIGLSVAFAFVIFSILFIHSLFTRVIKVKGQNVSAPSSVEAIQVDSLNIDKTADSSLEKDGQYHSM